MVAATLIAGLLFVGMTVVFLLCCTLSVMVVREVCQGYRELFRHARRHPRFGIGAVFSLTTIFAAACGIFRVLGDSNIPEETVFLAVVALMLALGAVCAVQFVLADVRESWSRHRAPAGGREFCYPESRQYSTDEVPDFSGRSKRA